MIWHSEPPTNALIAELNQDPSSKQQIETLELVAMCPWCSHVVSRMIRLWGGAAVCDDRWILEAASMPADNVLDSMAASCCSRRVGVVSRRTNAVSYLIESLDCLTFLCIICGRYLLLLFLLVSPSQQFL